MAFASAVTACLPPPPPPCPKDFYEPYRIVIIAHKYTLLRRLESDSGWLGLHAGDGRAEKVGNSLLQGDYYADYNSLTFNPSPCVVVGVAVAPAAARDDVAVVYPRPHQSNTKCTVYLSSFVRTQINSNGTCVQDRDKQQIPC